MGLFNRFKKEEKRKEEKKEIKNPQVRPVQKEKKSPAAVRKTVKKEFSEAAFKNLKFPLITEKTTILNNAKNQYVFAVTPSANKMEIKKAIQDLYGVHVRKVNIMNVPGKKRRVGSHEGWHSGYKKAIVFLAPEEKIEVISQ